MYCVPKEDVISARAIVLPALDSWPATVSLEASNHSTEVTRAQWEAGDRLDASGSRRLVLLLEGAAADGPNDDDHTLMSSGRAWPARYYFWPTAVPPSATDCAAPLLLDECADALRAYAAVVADVAHLVEAPRAVREALRARIADAPVGALLFDTASPAALARRHAVFTLYLVCVLCLRPGAESVVMGGTNSERLPARVTQWLRAERVLAEWFSAAQPDAPSPSAFRHWEAEAAQTAPYVLDYVDALRARLLHAWRRGDALVHGDERLVALRQLGHVLADACERANGSRRAYFELTGGQSRMPVEMPPKLASGGAVDRAARCVAAMIDVEDLALDTVPPCMRGLLQTARTTGELYHDDRFVLARWMVALAPHASTASVLRAVGNRLNPERLGQFRQEVENARKPGRRIVPTCQYVIAPKGAVKRAALVCPHASTPNNVAAAQRACSLACNGTSTAIRQPLDYTLAKLNM